MIKYPDFMCDTVHNDDKAPQNKQESKDKIYQVYNKKIQQCNLEKSKWAILSEQKFFLKQSNTTRELFFQQFEQKNGDNQRQQIEYNNLVILSTKDNVEPIHKKQGIQTLTDKLCGQVEFSICIHNIEDTINQKVKKIVDNSMLLYINSQQPSSKLTYFQQKSIQHNQKFNKPFIEDDFIIKVQGQDENQVSQLIKWQIIQSKCIQQFQQEALKSKINIISEPKNYCYKLQYISNQDVDYNQYLQLKRYHLTFKYQLQQVVILIYECRNNEEAGQISMILNNQIMLNLFNKELQTKNLIIDSLSKLQDNQIIKQQKGYVFAVVYNYLGLPLNQMQLSFQNIINNDSYIKTQMSLKTINLYSQEPINDINSQNTKIPQQQIQTQQQKKHSQLDLQQKFLQLTLELLEDDKSKKQQRNELNELILVLNGTEDIELKIQNPSDNILIHIQQIIQQSQLELSYFSLRDMTKLASNISANNDNQDNYKKIVHQINDQHQDQTLNEIKTIIFDLKILPELLKQAAEYGIDVDLDVNNFQYILRYHKDIEEQQIKRFQTLFRNKLRDTSILIHQCSCKEEAISKQKILASQQMKLQLESKFKLSFRVSFLIYNMCDYPIENINKKLKDAVRNNYKSNLLALTLIDYDNQNKISHQTLQQQFNQIIIEKIIGYQDKSQVIYVHSLLDLTEINFQIEKINFYHIQVQIMDPHYDNQQGKYYYHIIYNIWTLKELQAQFIKQQLQDLKNKVTSLMNPVVELTINEADKIQIWNKYLQSQYQHRQIYVDIFDKSIVLKFLSENQNNHQNKQEVCQNLKNLVYSKFSYKIDNKVIQVIKKYQKSKLFEKELQVSKESQKIGYLQISEIDELQQQIILEVIYQNHEEDFIQTFIQNDIIQNISIVPVPVDLKFNDLFLYLNKSKEEYEQEYRCYIQMVDNQATYVTISANQMKIQRSIDDYQQSQQNQIKNTQNEIITLKSARIQIQVKIWKYLSDKYEQQIKDIERKNQCRFAVESCQGNVIRAQIKFDKKVLSIAQGDITQEKCDAIIINLTDPINASNKDFVTKILSFGGQQFEKHIEQVLQQKDSLKEGNIFLSQNSTTVKNIISFPYIAESEIDQFKIQISSIFLIADKNQFKKLAITIPINEQNIPILQQACNIIITEYLLQIQNSKFVESIIIIEEKIAKIDIFINVLKEILNPPKIRQIKYQWQWKDGDGWKDYVDSEINQQIDEAFENYQNDNKSNEIKIVFPYTKQPGTHLIDFGTMIITDIATKQTQKISFKQLQDGLQYFFNGEPVNSSLNEYICKQKQKNFLNFQIFYKRHKVVFEKNKIIQYNLQTNYQREVRGMSYQQKQHLIKQCPINKQFEFQEIIQSQDIKNLNDLLEQINLVITGQSESGLELTKKYIQDLINRETANHEEQNYPKTWIPQNINMITVCLNETEEEYQNVKSLFKKSYEKGKIYQINRIQNKFVYENYHYEKKQLIRARQFQLTQNELERYVWHGVKDKHPQIIYSGTMDAFDISYSEAGMWGQGMYFAENSIYSKGYSYKLTPQDSQQYQGKLIFLLCLLTTGKVIKLSSDNRIKRPPDGYDCVQGNTGGSDIFVLYGMGVRRAYPAYEIIFE